MGKWIIPRHKFKKDTDYIRIDKNKAKICLDRRKRRIAKVAKERRENLDNLRYEYAMGNDEAKVIIGQCARKAKLTEKAAKNLVRTAFVELGRPMFAYKCPHCEWYHLTANPIKGKNYEIKCTSASDLR